MSALAAAPAVASCDEVLLVTRGPLEPLRLNLLARQIVPESPVDLDEHLLLLAAVLANAKGRPYS